MASIEESERFAGNRLKFAQRASIIAGHYANMPVVGRSIRRNPGRQLHRNDVR
jgi:hypothetical protein